MQPLRVETLLNASFNRLSSASVTEIKGQYVTVW